ncbi:MAG: TfoX/Sxy family protein, partial [Ardenticatenaceae bacterium]
AVTTVRSLLLRRAISQRAIKERNPKRQPCGRIGNLFAVAPQFFSPNPLSFLTDFALLANLADSFQKGAKMAVSPSYREYILEQLIPLLPIRARNMFGGVGIYSEDLFFAIISDDTLYFKVDDSNRPDYEAQAMPQFLHMQYYQVPPDVLEDPLELHYWAQKSLAVAKRKPKKKRKKKRKT